MEAVSRQTKVSRHRAQTFLVTSILCLLPPLSTGIVTPGTRSFALVCYFIIMLFLFQNTVDSLEVGCLEFSSSDWSLILSLLYFRSFLRSCK